MMSSIVGADAAVKIVNLLLILDQNMRHVSFISSPLVLPATVPQWGTFQTIVLYEYEVQ